MNQWREKREHHLGTAYGRPHLKAAQSVACITALLLLSACGGGGGGSSSVSSAGSPSANSLAQICTTGSPYVVDASSKTTAGTYRDEQNWVKAYLNERYFWYKDMPTNVQPTDSKYNVYTLNGSYFDYGQSVSNYFYALINQNKTSSGKYVDEFSFLAPTAYWNNYINSVEWGYGISVTGTAGSPNGVKISYVYPGSSGETAGFKRGDTITSIDGYSSTSTNVDIEAAFNAALYPTTATSHTFTLSRIGASVTITAIPTIETLKQVESKVLTNGNQKVGYLLFNSHVLSAEPDLIAATTSFKNQSVNDIVIDMRYNGGGYLSVASALSYSVAGAAKTAGKAFETVIYNDKRSKENFAFPFYDTSSSGSSLPSLNMTRAYVLASADTCSASEAVVNSLRGVGVDVQLIGATTCGKPYGFVAKDNCGVTYAAMEFVGLNAKTEQVSPDGMTPNCVAGDDLTHALGDSREAMLAVALGMQQGLTCAQAQQSAFALGSNVQRGFGVLLGGKLERPAWKSNKFIEAKTR